MARPGLHHGLRCPVPRVQGRLLPSSQGGDERDDRRLQTHGGGRGPPRRHRRDEPASTAGSDAHDRGHRAVLGGQVHTAQALGLRRIPRRTGWTGQGGTADVVAPAWRDGGLGAGRLRDTHGVELDQRDQRTDPALPGLPARGSRPNHHHPRSPCAADARSSSRDPGRRPHAPHHQRAGPSCAGQHQVPQHRARRGQQGHRHPGRRTSRKHRHP